jgi:hypothetical protein
VSRLFGYATDARLALNGTTAAAAGGGKRVAYEFGFDVVRLELDEVDAEEGEERQFELEAFSGDVSAHVAATEEGLRALLRGVEGEGADQDARPGGPWEPQLPQMKGFIFHPRIFLDQAEVHPPMVETDEEDETDFWELILDDEDGSRLMLRASEGTVRTLQRQIGEIMFGA